MIWVDYCAFKPPFIMAIDPGEDGSVCLMNAERQIVGVLSCKFDEDWCQMLRCWILNYHPTRIGIEHVHSITGNGLKSNWTFAKYLGKAEGAIESTGCFSFEKIETDWTKTIGMPKRREIIDAKKRRTVRRIDQELRALKLWPALLGWDAKKQGDVFASPLIALSMLVEHLPVRERQKLVGYDVDIAQGGSANDVNFADS